MFGILEPSLTLQCPWTITLKKVCQSSFFSNSQSSIRKMLPKSTAEILVHAFITSRLDNGNALLNGISEQQIHKLHIVQNSAARVLKKTLANSTTLRLFEGNFTGCPYAWYAKRYNTKPRYKTALLTWKARNNMAPSYISELLTPYIPPHSSFIWQMFTWNSKNILYFLRWWRILRCCTRTVEFTAFASSSDNQFKTGLKTFFI